MSEEINNIFTDNALLTAVQDKKNNDFSYKPSEVSIDVNAVNQLLEMLQQNQKVEQLETVKGLVDTISFIENNLNTAMAELKNIKEQLNIDTSLAPNEASKKTIITQIQKLESGLQKLKNQLNTIKQKFVDTVQNILDDVKEKGISALDKTSEFMSLKENLTALNEGFNNNISKIDKSINTINSMTQELKAATNHLKNVGRAMTGKERDGTMAQSSENIVKPLKAIKKMLVAMESKSANSITSVETLSKRANRTKTQEEKPSVLQALMKEKANIKEPTVTKPKAKEMAI